MNILKNRREYLYVNRIHIYMKIKVHRISECVIVTFLLEYALVHQFKRFEHSTLFLDTLGVWGHGSRSYPPYISMVASTGHKKHWFGFTGPKHLPVELEICSLHATENIAGFG